MVPTEVEGRHYQELALQGLGRLPPFSPILQRLMGRIADESTSFAALADLIEKDTALAGNVLRVVNSPLYCLSATVVSVRHGLAILGLAKLRNIVLSLSVSRLWARVRTPPGWSMSSFNRHGVAVAMLADQLALETAVPDGEGAFSAGLLHDLGKLLIAVTLPVEYQAIEPSGRGEEEVLGFTHAHLSAAALQRWNLPAPIVEAVRLHHQEPASGPLTLGGLLFAANRLAHSPDLGCRGFILERLGLAGKSSAFLDDFEREFQALGEFF